MQRRELLRRMLAGAPAATGAALAASGTFIRDTGDATRTKLEERFEQLKSRFEQSEERNKKLIRAALGAAALSLGLDISALL